MDPAEIFLWSEGHSELHHLRSGLTHHGTVIGHNEARLKTMSEDLGTLVFTLQTGQTGAAAAAAAPVAVSNPPLPTSSTSPSPWGPHLPAPER